MLKDLLCPLFGRVTSTIKNLSEGYYRLKPTKALYSYNFKGKKTLSCSHFKFRLYIQTKEKILWIVLIKRKSRYANTVWGGGGVTRISH